MANETPVTPNAAATNPAPTTAHAAGTTSTSLNPAPPSPPGGPTPPTAAPVENSWMNGFTDDMKGYVQNKGFKDQAALLDSYRNLEKLQGVPQDRLMKLPEKYYDENGNLTQESRSIYERLGAPKEAKEYEIAAQPGGDQARLDNFLKTAHDLGLTKTQAQKLAAADDGYYQQAVTRSKEAQTQAFKDQTTNLQKDWGAAYNDNVQNAREGVRKLGWDGAKIDALSSAIGHADAMKMFAQLGRSVGEASFVSSGGSNANRALEPAAAKQRIDALLKDSSFAAKLSSGDGDATALWNRLHEQAYQGTVNI